MGWTGIRVSHISSVEGRHLHLTNVKQVDGIIVTRISRKVVVKVGALPRLGDRSIMEGVGFVRPYTFHKTNLVLLVVMEDGIYRWSDLLLVG